jgi:hypothetical protein
MYGKAPKMASAKKPSKKMGVPVAIMVAVGKPKPMPKAPKMMKKMGRGK